ncbi:MAG: two-component hybrid sensor and regulator [Bacteroidetes bacterium]|nr:MAG: two-component hybrid sensor and regulator [Bacteroidota bacterium]
MAFKNTKVKSMKKQVQPLSDAATLRKKAEEQLKMRGEVRYTISPAESDLLKLIHELEVHQIELELQNEELILTKEMAELAEEKYTELYDFAPSGYISLLKNGTISELNFAAARMLGKERIHLVTKQFDLFITANTRPAFNAFFQRVFISKIKQTCEITIATEGQLPLHVSINGIVSQNGGFCLLTLTDITESKKSAINLFEAKVHAEESETRFRNYIQSSPTAAFLVDQNGKYNFANHSACLLLGYTEEEMLQLSVFDIVKTDINEKDTSFSRLKHKGEIRNVEKIMYRKDGQAIDVILDAKKLSENEYIGFVIDISERKRAEAALRESEEKYRVLFSTFPLGITISDSSGNIVESNSRAAELLGVSKEEHEARRIDGEQWRIIRPDGTPMPVEEYASTLALKGNRLVENVEMGIVKQNEEITWLNVSAAPLLLENYGTAITYSDISGRRKMENALLENEERLRLALKATNDVVWDWDIVNDTQRWNEAGKKVFGWNEIVDGTVNAAWWTERIHPDDLKRVETGFNAAMHNKTDIHWQDEYRFRKSDGTYSDVLDRGYMLRDNQGKAIRMIGAMLDITARKQAEQELKRIEWLLTSRPQLSEPREEKYMTPYGDLVALNTCRFILDSVGRQTLTDIVGDYLNLLDTSAAVYEKNGDYALGIFSSGWCRFMDAASRSVCCTDDNREALECGSWHCHESCWTRASLTAIETGLPADIDCDGGIHLFAVPIQIGDEIVGVINLGYGDPPRDETKLMELATLYQVSYEELRTHAMNYESRPPYIVDLAKQRLMASARLIGEIIERKMAEKELIKSEERYALVIEASEQGIWDWNVETNEVFYSEQWKKQIGYNKHELKNEFDTWVEHLHPDEKEYCQNAVSSYLRHPVEHFILEFRFRHKDGSYRWIHNKAASLKNNEGKVIRLFGTHTDITESKLSEAIFKDIVEKNPMSIQILDMDGYPIQINPAHTRLFGVELPSGYSVLKDPQLLLKGFGELFDRVKNGEVVYFPDSYYNVHDLDLTFPDLPIWVKALGFTLNDYNGKPDKIVLMHENITERKNAEALLNDIIEKNPISIQIVDKEGLTLRGNPAYAQLFGALPPAGFSIFDDLKSKSPELGELISAVKNGEIVHLPDIYFNAHDAVAEAPDIPLWIRALIFPLKDSGGKPERFVFMHENITESKIAEQELIKAKEKAEESDRLKSAFLANMSHEIRTPMNGILGFAELLKNQGLTGEEQLEYLKIIEKSGERMLIIINDIVDISKIEAGLMNLNISDTNINEKIEFIHTFFKPQVEEKGMQLLSKKSLPEKDAVIRTDSEKLYSILTNLVKNAIKYTTKGNIEFGYNKRGDTLEFYVKDTGIGIPKERQSAIFERFIQADITDKMAQQGAGLGLSIAKAYVEMLGGEIRVESKEGIGSTFYFTLPYNVKPDEIKAVPADDTVTDNMYRINPEISGLKILIAEDDETSEKLISIIVREFSKDITEARTGNEVVEICRNNPEINLILMDIQMPEISGYEATRQIRKFNKDVVIIAQTAYGLSGDREKAIEAGCNDYLSKPISKAGLISMIHKYFRK